MNFRIFKSLIMVNQFAITVLGPIIMMVAIGVAVRHFFNLDFTLICVVLGVLAGARNGYIFARKIFEENNKNNGH